MRQNHNSLILSYVTKYLKSNLLRLPVGAEHMKDLV